LLKEPTRCAARRASCLVRSTSPMSSEGPDGKQTLGRPCSPARSQLIVKHFMLGPALRKAASGCSFGADKIDSALVHLINHDVMYVAVSRAPTPRLPPSTSAWLAFQVGLLRSAATSTSTTMSPSPTRKRRAARRSTTSSSWTTMNDELPGYSVFFKDEAATSSIPIRPSARGTELPGRRLRLPRRDTQGPHEPPGGNLTAWVRITTKYEEKPGDFLPATARPDGCKLWALLRRNPCPQISLDHWNVYCKDLKATVDFYEKYVVSMPVTARPSPSPARGSTPARRRSCTSSPRAAVTSTGGAIDHVRDQLRRHSRHDRQVKADGIPFEVKRSRLVRAAGFPARSRRHHDRAHFWHEAESAGDRRADVLPGNAMKQAVPG